MPNKKVKKEQKTLTQEDVSLINNNDILTPGQKNELVKIIDSLVEERVLQRNKLFVEKYTKFITESAANKIVGKVKEDLTQKFNEEIDRVHSKANKIVRSLVLESASKINKNKNAVRIMVEEFKEKSPKLIEKLAEEKAVALAEDSVAAIEKKERLENVMESISKGLAKAGFVINEDIDRAIDRERSEKMMLRTKLTKANRDILFHKLTEGMLPEQKKEMSVLLEDCTTSDMLESKFVIAKQKVMESREMTRPPLSNEDKRKMKETNEMMQEDESFTELLKLGKFFQ